ncbi:MAG: elongation factor G [Candidatus Lambdaproteobacteria bacterium]|nr:elongation factor G [Candidatus Lambdaproteobacteria bacterium]
MGLYTIGLVAHVGAGKTSLAEAMLAQAGTLKKMGSVDQGTSALDFEPEAREHKTSTHSSLATLAWEGHQIDVIDTPGSTNFLGSTAAALRVVDGAVMLSSAEPGLQGQTEQLWEYLEARATPRLLAISKLDRDQADFHRRLEQLNGEFDNRFVAVQIPWGQAGAFKGVVDLIESKAYDCSNPEKPRAQEVPPELAAQVETYRRRLCEAAAETDDGLLELYLDKETLDPANLLRGLIQGTHSAKLVPVLCTAATRPIGADLVLRAIVTLLPDAPTRRAQRKAADAAPPGYVADSFGNAEFSALVFKTKIDHYAGRLSVIRVMSGEVKPGEDLFNPATSTGERPAHLFKLIGKEQKEVTVLRTGELGALPKLNNTHTGHTLCSPKRKVEFAPLQLPAPVLTYALQIGGKGGEEEKVSSALHRMMEEDLTLSFRHSAETGDFLVSGMGQMHLDLVLERLKREYQIAASYQPPHVPYRETIRAGSKAQGKYKKQTGGRGQYGDCWLELKPNGQAEELAFHSAIVGGAIPRNFIPAIEKGIAEALGRGVLAGYPVIGIDATVYDGSFHDVDSSEMAFKIAGSMAFKKAMEQARPVLLEPVYELEIVVHTDHTGDVMGDINARRGRVLGMENRGKRQVVRAEVPLGEALKYAVELRALTSGTGYFTQKFVRYDEMPAPLAEKIIKARVDHLHDSHAH